MYFSPSSGTKKIILGIGERIFEKKTIYKGRIIDFTLPMQRENGERFTNEDILIIGVPVYAGRVPNVLLNYLNTIRGKNSLAIPVVVYGNRHYDDALIELNDILIENGFRVIAGGAFIGEHSFSRVLAKDRPDNKDIDIARDFADKVYNKLELGDYSGTKINGNRPYRPYYKPRDENDTPVDIRKVKPKTNDDCIDCKICSQVCPMGSIPYEDVTALVGICIKCCACVKLCPMQAKYFDQKDYLRHKKELEENCTERRIPEVFID